MIYSVAIKQSTNINLLQHLIRDDGQEDLCFALHEIGTGKNRITGLITEIILPVQGEKNLHGNVSINHSYFDRVVQIALHKRK